ncbi:MAG: hypothetical protein IPM38_09480 [Ignavibacteria bacterium]|nr:hypothetical protein [Ignavibacteria bacterium]
MSERDNIRRLMSEDIEEIQKFYADAYPGNWFDMRMLETENISDIILTVN